MQQVQHLAHLDVDLDRSSDATLAASAADQISVPREAPATSFVLHAPLELLARSALLPFVDVASRAPARQRIAEVATTFGSFDEATFSGSTVAFADVDAAIGHLARAMEANDLDAADEASDWLGTHLAPSELSEALADLTIGSLAAAAHTPIFLWLLPRVSPRRNLTGRLLRPLARELTRRSTPSIRWVDATNGLPSVRTRSGTTDAEMTAALASTPLLGEGPSDFILPTMSRVDVTELAPTILGPVCGPGDIAGRARAIKRAAAWSMLGEPPTHAPYGWTHALTMSQAAIGIAGSCADPTRALAIAATYVMGFRASFAVEPLVEAFEPDRPSVSLQEALDGGPDAAAAAAWHHPAERRAELVTELASRASAHPDAHQVKYTLACLDAIGDDPGSAQLFLAAAAKLIGHWASADLPGEH